MNWSERELDLFKSRRQRGTRPATPLEFYLHVSIADVLRRWCSNQWRYTHLPMGEKRPPATAARLARMGVTRGWSDFMFFHNSGKVCFLELKRSGGKATIAQEDLAVFLSDAGHDYLLVDNFKDALNWLQEHNIVPSTINDNTSRKDAAPCAQGDEAIE